MAFESYNCHCPLFTKARTRTSDEMREQMAREKARMEAKLLEEQAALEQKLAEEARRQADKEAEMNKKLESSKVYSRVE